MMEHFYATMWSSIFLGTAVICLGCAIAYRRDPVVSMVYALAATVLGVIGAFVGFRG